MRAPIAKAEAEGGCGVIGIAASEPVHGRHLLQALDQMRNRGNGKGGGVAMSGLDPAFLGVDAAAIRDCYALGVAYLEEGSRAEVEREYVDPIFDVVHVQEIRNHSIRGLEIPPPKAVVYMVHPRADVVQRFAEEAGLGEALSSTVADEVVYQNSYRLNRAFYSSLGDKQAFVLSHGKDMLVLKLVGYGDDAVRAYGLEEARAHVWIGHHRYPTKGRVWHPGGAHPFVGMHEALVHNGDFANYASVCSYLAQRNIHPLFLTDTEVSVLVFDLLHRTYGYSLEHVIEALAPTTERDFEMLPDERRRVYELLQTVHIHGSPDGPWFFLIAQSADAGESPREARLIGITDTSMLRPQVFAVQRSAGRGPEVAFAASEKQAIDAALESLSETDGRYGRLPDRVWNARGGSHTDGGAFVFRVHRGRDGTARLAVEDKFGRPVDIAEERPPRSNGRARPAPASGTIAANNPERLRLEVLRRIPQMTYADLELTVGGVGASTMDDESLRVAVEALTFLCDRRYPTGGLRPRSVREILLKALDSIWDRIRESSSEGYTWAGKSRAVEPPSAPEQTLVLDGRAIPPDGPRSLAHLLRQAVDLGHRRIHVVHTRGHRFLGAGLGPSSAGIRIDVYGSPGDYLASGVDGAEVVVHANGQDQLAQIMKAGRLVVHGDVGQTFMYAAKGGEVFVLGNAAGRPLINAVGRPRVVINGTCLDYLAESFMAGDPLAGGGFVVLNGVAFDSHGELRDLAEPYPGGNLFSLASGGAIFLRDPMRKVGSDQLNGGEFGTLTASHWELIEPLLRENERHFGIPIHRLLTFDGELRPPADVYRIIQPAGHRALMPEEAWVTRK
ncbi:MAG TPA: hypothetical protein VFI11_07885 [Anaerolineales bacterium]|nr:hypothetical protein [Anaerolineales bacterium]